jgi:hypothetical protein
MIIESTLNRQEFVRYSLNRHFSRPSFFVYAFIFAALTTYTLVTPGARQALYLAAILPLLAYILGGWIAIVRRSRDKDMPLYLPIRYEFSKHGIETSSRLGRSELPWSDVREWHKTVGVYELSLKNGQMLVITERAFAPQQISQFEELLKKQVST